MVRFTGYEPLVNPNLAQRLHYLTVEFFSAPRRDAGPTPPTEIVYHHCDLFLVHKCEQPTRGAKQCAVARECVRQPEKAPPCGPGVYHLVKYSVVQNTYYPLRAELFYEDLELPEPQSGISFNYMPIAVSEKTYKTLTKMVRSWTRSCTTYVNKTFHTQPLPPKNELAYPINELVELSNEEYARMTEMGDCGRGCACLLAPTKCCGCTTHMLEGCAAGVEKIFTDLYHMAASCFGRPNNTLYNRSLYYTGTTGCGLACGTPRGLVQAGRPFCSLCCLPYVPRPALQLTGKPCCCIGLLRCDDMPQPRRQDACWPIPPCCMALESAVVTSVDYVQKNGPDWNVVGKSMPSPMHCAEFVASVLVLSGAVDPDLFEDDAPNLSPFSTFQLLEEHTASRV